MMAGSEASVVTIRSAVRLHLLRGAARTGEILVAVRDVKEIERVYRTGHRNLQVVATSRY
jgi:hypothetical protein